MHEERRSVLAWLRNTSERDACAAYQQLVVVCMKRGA